MLFTKEIKLYFLGMPVEENVKFSGKKNEYTRSQVGAVNWFYWHYFFFSKENHWYPVLSFKNRKWLDCYYRLLYCTLVYYQFVLDTSIEGFPYFFGYKTEFFLFQNNPKNLDLSYKMDLDLWDCLVKEKLIL